MYDINQIKALINAHGLPEETKNLLLKIADDSSLTDDQKKDQIWKILASSKKEMGDKINEELKPIYDEAEQEMEAAEKDYKDELAKIEKEAEEIYEETSKELASLPEEE